MKTGNYTVEVEVKTKWTVIVGAVDEADAAELVESMDPYKIESQGSFEETVSVEVGDITEEVVE